LGYEANLKKIKNQIEPKLGSLPQVSAAQQKKQSCFVDILANTCFFEHEMNSVCFIPMLLDHFNSAFLDKNGFKKTNNNLVTKILKQVPHLHIRTFGCFLLPFNP